MSAYNDNENNRGCSARNSAINWNSELVEIIGLVIITVKKNPKMHGGKNTNIPTESQE